MARVSIIKGNIRNVVEEEQFEKLYKPNGWKRDDSPSESNQDIPLEILNTEKEVKNFIKMKNKQLKHFDDGLFFSEGEK